ncbi:hypothetical protein BD770DRAFT_54102 [Pilaira anomala]|nr:hypothetical protein BD770DRAFT_54102 [Pilaira anomala]
MGQSVGGHTLHRRRESFSSCISASSCDSTDSSSETTQNTTNTNSCAATSNQDDVTRSSPQSLFPSKTCAKSPSNSDEPSMSSSIIETTSVKEESNKVNQNVAGKQRLASKIIPKRAWSGYHLFQLTNMRGERISSSPRVIRSPKIRPKSKYHTIKAINSTTISTASSSNNFYYNFYYYYHYF